MQFINKNSSLKTFLVILYGCASLIIAESQLDVRFNTGIGGDSVNAPKLTKAYLNPNVNYSGSYNLAPHFQILIQENYDGIFPLGQVKDSVSKKLLPFADRFVLSTNTAGLGLRLNAYGDIHLSAQNIFYIDRNPLTPYYSEFMDPYPYDTLAHMLSRVSLERIARTNFNVYTVMPFKFVEFIVDVNYFGTNLKKKTSGIDLNTGEDVVLQNIMTLESDVWSYLALKFNLPLNLKLNVGTNRKDNFSGNAFLNFTKYEAYIEGDHAFPNNNRVVWAVGSDYYNLMPESKLSEKYVESRKNNFYETGLAYHIYIRDVYTLGWGFYLKGTAIYDIGRLVFKQKYDISLRKAWQSESFVELGYFNSLGGLYPMCGGYFRGSLRPIPRFAITYTGKANWELFEQPLAENDTIPIYKYEYLKSNHCGEITFRALEKLDILLGGEFFLNSRNLKTYAFENFPRRINFYGGIRGWL
jgi:hypothetical protein